MEENFTAGDTDFKAILTNIANLDYDVIFLPGYYEEGGLIHQTSPQNTGRRTTDPRTGWLR